MARMVLKSIVCTVNIGTSKISHVLHIYLMYALGHSELKILLFDETLSWKGTFWFVTMSYWTSLVNRYILKHSNFDALMQELVHGRRSLQVLITFFRESETMCFKAPCTMLLFVLFLIYAHEDRSLVEVANSSWNVIDGWFHNWGHMFVNNWRMLHCTVVLNGSNYFISLLSDRIMPFWRCAAKIELFPWSI